METLNNNSVTKNQMADKLGLSLRTLQRKLASVGLIVPRGLICSDTQAEILNKLGYTKRDKPKD